MRIRKNTKLSSILFDGDRPDTYVCHLNQSPWDVISVDCDGAVKFTNLLESSWFVPSSPSLIPQSNEFDGEDDSFNVSLGDSNGALHSLNLTSDIEEPMDLNDQVDITMPVPPKRGRPRGTLKKAPPSIALSNNPNEFYYYSGFGPRWGRKRGTEKSNSSDEEDDKTAAYRSGSCSLDRFDYGDDNYDLMNEDEKKKKKRGRKPVKERSLKSLM